ncbi:MAG TPA: hypothetical protein ENI60_07220 [Candidatus Fraserbacteria bacterium]|nr:hypothetical protein [Candidatus Fraserbacteria bacterium]
MAQSETVFEYEVDYEGARAKAKEMARRMQGKHPEIGYRIVTRYDEGVFLELYGPDEERIRRIAKAMDKRVVDLILAGTPVYVIYGGPEEP